MNKQSYFDYAATTPLDPQVIDVVKHHLEKTYGNSASMHSVGMKARKVLSESREKIAFSLNAFPDDIYFTGSATESNNTVLKGVALANRKKGKHIIVSGIEHDCVLESSHWLQDYKFEVEKAPVDEYGMIELDKLESMIREDTILVSIMHANNEIGTIQPIEEIGNICDEKDVYFHTDAAQTFGKLDIDLEELNIDLLTASAHKIYGPKGVALLFKREEVKIEPLLHGGGHESGFRSSTVNVPLIAGFAEAVRLVDEKREEESKRLSNLRDKIFKVTKEQIDKVIINGHPTKRLYNNVNMSFLGIEGEALLMELDNKGIQVSTGSACSSPKLRASHVLLATGAKPEEAHGSIRISLGRWTTEEQVNYLLRTLPEVVEKLREMSPF